MEDKRMRWKGRFEFVFASFGYTIGLGNLWRFPQKCYSNGGGVFLIPYLLCVILCTIPTLFLEFSLGQITSEGCIKVWKFSPLIQGVGFAIWFNLLMCVIYYNVLLMYALYYMLVSFVSIGADLPWSHCRAEDSWSTDKCRSPVVIDRDKNNPTEINQAMAKYMNETCISELGTELGVTPYSLSVQDFEKRFSACKVDFFTPEEEYWTRFVLGVDKSSGFDDLGAIQGRNVMMLLTVWIIVYYCCIRGIRSIAKFILIASAKGYTKSSYAGVEVTPGGEAIGWLLIITPLVIIISFGSFQIWKRGGVKNALKPVQDPSTAYSEPDLVPEVDNADMRLGELNGNFNYRAETQINGRCNTENGRTTQNPMYDSGGIVHVDQEEVDPPPPPPLQCDSLNGNASICVV